MYICIDIYDKLMRVMSHTTSWTFLGISICTYGAITNGVGLYGDHIVIARSPTSVPEHKMMDLHLDEQFYTCLVNTSTESLYMNNYEISWHTLHGNSDYDDYDALYIMYIKVINMASIIIVLC